MSLNHLLFSMFTKLPNPDAVRAFTEKHNLRYYNEDIHTASFATPGFVKELLK